jgi:putative transposase
MKQHETGIKAVDGVGEHEINEATFYNRKSNFGGTTVAEAQRLRYTEDENHRLKQLVADLSLDIWELKSIIRKRAGVCRLDTSEDKPCRGTPGPVRACSCAIPTEFQNLR